MPAATESASSVDDFLDCLIAEGFAVGMRERLTVHTFLTRLAADGELPSDDTECLRLLEPLLAKNEQEQQRFAAVAAGFLRSAGGTGTGGRLDGLGGRSSAGLAWRLRNALRRPRTRIAIASLVVVALIAALAIYRIVHRPEQEAATTTTTTASPDTDGSTPRVPATPDVTDDFPLAEIYAPVAPPLAEPPDLRILRWALGGVSALLAALLGIWLSRQIRRALYLQRVRTDREVEEHVLRDPAPVEVALEAGHVRRVSRMLRQQMAGTREELNIPATLQATIRSRGALTPRFRSILQTPEYIVLVDRASAHDHQAAFHELMVDALRRAGVAVDLFQFEGSPAHGCWRRQGSDVLPAAAVAPRTVQSFAQLANRYGGNRLLVFGDASSALDPLGLGAAKWTRDVGAFPHRAWLSPFPLGSWGASEAGVDALGFLVLPAQPEALDTLAEWLSSERAVLRPSAQWQSVFPATLRGSAAPWVTRQTPPPPEVEQALLLELRTYLGPERFQWLCACAVFPVLSWPLTLAIGRSVLATGGHADGPALAQGIAALGALPWFRYARMPRWLRESLLDRLDPAEEKRLRAVVKERLEAAIEGGTGAAMVDVAIPRWFSRRKGLARDVVLAGFLDKGISPRLAQQMPEGLRRLLFKDGKALYGIRAGAIAASALAASLLAVAVAPRAWEAWTARASGLPSPSALELAPPTDSITRGLSSYVVFRGRSYSVVGVAFSPDGQRIAMALSDQTARVWQADGSGTPIVLRGHGGAVYSVAFSPDGQRIVTGSEDNTARVWRADGTGTPVVLHGHQDYLNSVQFSPDGERVVTGSQDGTARVWRADGTGTPLVLRGHEANIWFTDFSPDGQRIVTASADGTARVWRSDGTGTPQVLRVGGGEVFTAEFSPNGELILTGSGDGAAQVWRADGSGTPLLLQGNSAAVWGATFSPDGRWILTTSSDGTAHLWRADGSGTAVTLYGHADGIPSGAFSPDGRRIVTGSHDGTARVWGGPLRLPIAILTCDISDATAAPALELADSLARVTRNGLPRFAPVVYGLSSWDSNAFGLSLDYGEVRFALNDSTARTTAGALWGRFSTGPDPLPFDTVGASAPPFAVTVGLCASAGTAPDSAAVADMTFLTPDSSGQPAEVTAPEPAPAPGATAPALSSGSRVERPITYSESIVNAIRQRPGVSYPAGVNLPSEAPDQHIVAIILHVAQGPDNVVQMLRSGRADLPGPLSHWAVQSDGTIAFIAPESERAYHVGNASSGITNRNSIGIEATGIPAFADARQVEALVRLVADVADRWNVPTNRIFAHAEVGLPAGRKTDMKQQAPAIREMVAAIRAER